MKVLLVVTNLHLILGEDDARLKRFVKVLNRGLKTKVLEVMPGVWFVKTEEKANQLTDRLSGLLERKEDADKEEQLIITTLRVDSEHLNGWLDKEKFWQFAGYPPT